MTFSTTDLLYQSPLLALALTGVFLVLAEAFASGHRGFLTHLTVIGCAVAAACAIGVWKAVGDGERVLMSGVLVADRFAMFFILLACAITALTALASKAYLRAHATEVGEYFGLLALSASGMAILAMSRDLVAVFIGVETMSIAAYVLVATRRRSRRSIEGAMKYFLMGAFASAILLYGIALIYGATGTTNLAEITSRLSDEAVLTSPLLVIGLFLLVASLGFKIAVVPFHSWAPDAYEGAPTPVTGFMAAGVKAAAFSVIVRVFLDTFGGDILPYGRMGWGSIFAILAAITMTVGNLAALRQDNIKRMLAYSSVAHAGTVLVAVVAAGVGAGASARPAILFYLLAYSATTLGAFGVVAWIGSRGRERVLLEDWNGLAAEHPGQALAMTVFMLSLGGIPPTAGFLGKFYVFQSAMQAYDQQLLWLVIVGVLNSVVSIYYYLRVVTAMYFRDALEPHAPIRSGATTFVLVVCALLVLEMGVFPGWWFGVIP